MNVVHPSGLSCPMHCAMVPELKTASKDRIQTHVIVADLSKPGAAQALFDAVAALLTPGGGGTSTTSSTTLGLPPRASLTSTTQPTSAT